MSQAQQDDAAPERDEPGASTEDWRLVERLRGGDEAAFAELIDRYHNSLLRLALAYVPDQAAAEEAVGDTWLGVLHGLNRFEGRSSLKTWIFRILTNRAKSRGQREARSLPFSALAAQGDEAGSEPSVEPDRFLPANHLLWPRHWASFPHSWDDLPEQRFLSRETLDHVRQAIAALPPAQRAVITLRDVEGWTAGEACAALDISEANQRVLLHRARSKVRRALEQYLYPS
jgi:RNA polymerase sigma-70 factor, ECF subfamily